MKMIRTLYSLYCIVTFVLLFLIIFPFFLVLSFMGKTGEKGIWYLIKGWSVVWFFVIGQRTKVIGWNKTYKSDFPVVCIANHQSYLDTAMIFRALPFMASPLAKYDLAKLPLFGLMYKKMAILIDRSSVKSRKIGYLKLNKMIKQDQRSIFIFPEGTFDERSGKVLLPFYDGAFRIAIETQRPILPILFLDTRDRFDEKKLWRWTPGITRTVFLPPAWPPTSLKDLETFKHNIREEMLETLKKYKA